MSPPLLLAEFSEYRLPCCSVEIETRDEESFSHLSDNKGDLRSSLVGSRMSSFSSSSSSRPTSCSCPPDSSSSTTLPPSEEENSRLKHSHYRNSTAPHVGHSLGEDSSSRETKNRINTPPSTCHCSDPSMATNEARRDTSRSDEETSSSASSSSNISVLPGGQGVVTLEDHRGFFSHRTTASPSQTSLDREIETAFSLPLRTSIVLTERRKSVVSSSSSSEGGGMRNVHKRQGGQESLGRDEAEEDVEEDLSNKRRRRRRKTSHQEEDWWIGRVEVTGVASISLRERTRGLPPRSRREEEMLLSSFQKKSSPLAMSSWSSSSSTTIKMKRGDIQQFEVVLHDVYGREILTPSDLRSERKNIFSVIFHLICLFCVSNSISFLQ